MVKLNYDYFLHFPFGLMPKYYSLKDVLMNILHIKESDPILNASIYDVIDYVKDTLSISLFIINEAYVSDTTIDYDYSINYDSLQYKLNINDIKRNIAKQKADYGLITMLTKKRVPNFITAYNTELNLLNDKLELLETNLENIPLVSKSKPVMKITTQSYSKERSDLFVITNKFDLSNNKTLLLFLHAGDMNKNPIFQVYHNNIISDIKLPYLFKQVNSITPIGENTILKPVEEYNRKIINDIAIIDYSLVNTSINNITILNKLIFLTPTNTKNNIIILAILNNNDINQVINYMLKDVKSLNIVDKNTIIIEKNIKENRDVLTSIYNKYKNTVNLSTQLSRFKSIYKILNNIFELYKTNNKIINNAVDEFTLYTTLYIYRKIEPYNITRVENFILAILYLYDDSFDQIRKYSNIMNYKIDLVKYNYYKSDLKATIVKKGKNK